MFQTVVNFISKLFNPILPTEWRNHPKRRREDEDDDLFELAFDDPPIKKIKMNSNRGEASGSSYFPGPYYSKTREKCSQTYEVIDLDPSPPIVETISLLDETNPVYDKENSSALKISPLKNSSPSKNKFRAPAHCRSPLKTKFKHVSLRRGSSDVQHVATYHKDFDSPDLVSTSKGQRPVIRRMASSQRKPFHSRTEHIMSLAMRNPESLNTSAIFDFNSRKKYGELLGKVLKTPEMFSCSPSQRTVTTPSKIIDLTENEPSTHKSGFTLGSSLSQKCSSFVDLTGPHPSTKKHSTDEVINLEDSDNVIPVGTFIPHRRIVSPINSLSTKLKHVPCARNDCVSNLVTEIENFKKDYARDQERLIKEISALKPFRKTFEKALEERLKRHLKITTIDLDDEEEKEPVKPELTESMISAVINAWDQKKSKSQVLANNFNYQIKRIDLQTLSGLNWLNDEVINFYMELLMARGKEKDFPSVHCFSTFFYPKLVKDGYSSLRRWTRKIDIFSYDMIIVPIHLRVHWCLAIVDFKKKEITYFDSMGQGNDSCVNGLLEYLVDEHMDKKKQVFDSSGWKLICTMETVPQQMNSCDCGVFACTFAEYASRKAKYNFSQSDMPYFRKKMTYEILTSSLLSWT